MDIDQAARSLWWQDAWIALCHRREKSGLGGLAPYEKTWFVTRTLIDAIANGGIISFYYNSGADWVNETIEALRRLSAPEVVRQIERVNALFPCGMVPRTLDERNEAINTWDGNPEIDRVLTEIDQMLLPMLELLEQRLDYFIHTQGVVNRDGGA